MDIERFSSLTKDFYAAALEPEKWAGLGAHLAASFGAESSVVQTQNRTKNQVEMLTITSNFDRPALQTYLDHYARTDLWINAGASIGFPGVYLGQELIDDKSLLRSEFYGDWARHVGVFHLLGSGTPLDHESGVAIIGIHRPIGSDPFDPDDKKWVHLLLPHLRHALAMRHRLASLDRQRQIGFEALEALAIGVILVGASGEILFTNGVAETLLRAGQGIRASQGRLRAQDHAQAAALEQAIRCAATIAHGKFNSIAPALALKRRDGRALSALVCPWPSESYSSGLVEPAAIVFLSNPDHRQGSSLATLTALYGLTPAEARLFAALLDGMRLEDYAESVGITINTVNTQLKQIFAKTGQNRQSDLIRQALSDRVVLLERFRNGRK